MKSLSRLRREAEVWESVAYPYLKKFLHLQIPVPNCPTAFKFEVPYAGPFERYRFLLLGFACQGPFAASRFVFAGLCQIDPHHQVDRRVLVTPVGLSDYFPNVTLRARELHQQPFTAIFCALEEVGVIQFAITIEVCDNNGVFCWRLISEWLICHLHIRWKTPTFRRNSLKRCAIDRQQKQKKKIPHGSGL